MSKRVAHFLLLTGLLVTFVMAPLKPTFVYGKQADEGSYCSPNRGLDVVFVVDNSARMNTNDPNYIRIEAMLDMVKGLHEYDRFSVIKFAEGATNLQGLTNNHYVIEEALSQLASPTGGTDMSEGIDAALAEFAKSSGNNHKVMIILSHGHSVNNALSLQHAQTAYEQNIKMYSIGIGLTNEIDDAIMKRVADITGGKYFHATNATHLKQIFNNIKQAEEDLREPKVFSDRTLTEDLHMAGNLVLQENMNLNLNGYDLTVDGDLVLLSCAELRAISGKITAKNLEQSAGSRINLNNSQLNVKETFTQDGILQVNGDYGGTSIPEITIEGNYNQKIRGFLDLKGQLAHIKRNLVQDGRIHVGGGEIHVAQDVTQKGWFNLQQGKLLIDGNLVVAGGPLTDDEFATNKSLNVGGGLLQVGSLQKYRNVFQTGGQLYVNHGTVRIYGDYTIRDGWLTMIKGSMDTTSKYYTEADGDYVHVFGNFSMESKRNHGGRNYSYLGKPMNDQVHLTDGVLRIDGNFRQLGDGQFHSQYSDRSQNYEKDYSRYNFTASGRHKVLLTGKGSMNVQSSDFRFNILELEGRLVDYTWSGGVKWNRLIENDAAANANLNSLSINDIPVRGFQANVLTYYNHVVPSHTVQGPLRTLKVDARADDHRNATVEVIGNNVKGDGTAEVQVLVTAHDGKTTRLYTIHVVVGGSSPDAVSSLELDRERLVFMKGTTEFQPKIATIGYTIKPSTAENQKVHWTSADPSIATVSQNGIVTPMNEGKTTITATTDDGGFKKFVHVEVKLPNDLFSGVKTLADFIDDNDRYNQIMSLYDPQKIGIVVPGEYIKKVTFDSSSYLVVGTIETNATVERVEVRINNEQLNAPKNGANYLFTRAGLEPGDYLEVIAYNSAGDELERIGTAYPVNFTPTTIVPYGFYSVQKLMNDPVLFNEILRYYSPEQLRFIAK